MKCYFKLILTLTILAAAALAKVRGLSAKGVQAPSLPHRPVADAFLDGRDSLTNGRALRQTDNGFSCPEHANCSKDFVVPKPNYWNSDPCQPEMKACLNEDACRREKKDWNPGSEALSNSAVLLDSASKELDTECRSMNPGRFDNENVTKYRDLISSEGYQGVLRGSCTAGCGQTTNLEFEECQIIVTYAVFLLAALWIVGIVTITMNGNRVLSSKVLIAALPSKDQIPLIKTVGTKKSDVRTGSESSDPQILATNDLEHEDIDQKKHAQLLKWRLAEFVKVTINFLEAIAMAFIVNMEWRGHMPTNSICKGVRQSSRKLDSRQLRRAARAARIARQRCGDTSRL